MLDLLERLLHSFSDGSIWSVSFRCIFYNRLDGLRRNVELLVVWTQWWLKKILFFKKNWLSFTLHHLNVSHFTFIMKIILCLKLLYTFSNSIEISFLFTFPWHFSHNFQKLDFYLQYKWWNRKKILDSYEEIIKFWIKFLSISLLYHLCSTTAIQGFIKLVRYIFPLCSLIPVMKFVLSGLP